MPQRYEGKYTDHISRNLVVAMENAGYTVEEFAAEAGVSDRTIRTHLKSSGSIKLSVLEKYAHILHIGVSDITSRDWLPRNNWTGIPPLDRVISAYIRSENEPKYREEASHYIAGDYLCISTHYRPDTYGTDSFPGGGNYTKVMSNPDLWGMDWKTEQRLNANSDAAYVINTSKILCMYMISKVGVTILREIHQMRRAVAGQAVPRYVSDEVGGIQENIISTMITLNFKHRISDSLADPTNKPFLIRRKGWHLISVTQRNVVKEQPR